MQQNFSHARKLATVTKQNFTVHYNTMSLPRLLNR